MTLALHKIGCDEDEHTRYGHFADFNERLDGEEGLDGRSSIIGCSKEDAIELERQQQACPKREGQQPLLD
jgi:hypothetical protein